MTSPTPHFVSPLAVCVLPPPVANAPRSVRYGQYAHEILQHAGLCFEPVELPELDERLEQFRLLVTVGETEFGAAFRERLGKWVSAGGAWLSVGGLCGMGDLLGASYRQPAMPVWGGALGVLGEGYLVPIAMQHPVLRGIRRPLHYFGGISVTEKGGDSLARALDAHQRPADFPLLVESAPGAGRCLLIAPDLTGTVVHVQQGRSITRDGMSAPDSTAPLADGVLKSDDGQVLDWLFDREPVPGAPGMQAFLHLVADQWRELLLRAIFYLARAQNVSLPLLWYYPEGRPALGHLSHDTDGNDPALGKQLLDVLRSAGVRSTWCVILPGYDRTLISRIRNDGHELAMHFDAMSPGCPWDEPHFDEQFRRLSELFGGAPGTNKNHYLRWEGDTEFFDWCAARGIRLDQSKGVSKTGGAGFNFGTCHPYRPIAPDGRVFPILELPTPTQDLIVFAPEALAAPLLDAAVEHHGILHLLFHPAHIPGPGVAAALAAAVRAGEARGLTWWTACDIAAWENARRAARWSDFARGGEGSRVTLTAEQALPGATLFWLDTGVGHVSVDGEGVASQPVERWGFAFRSVEVDLAEGDAVRLGAG